MEIAERKHKESNWTCFLCTAFVDSEKHVDLNSSIEEVAKGIKQSTRSSLRILQWNADGLKSKSDELGLRLKELDIDIAVIQETWLSSKNNKDPEPTPIIQGYDSYRADRKVNLKRGGLIFYIKTSIPFDKAGHITKSGQEILTLRARLGRNKWISITNYLLPPSSKFRRSGHRL